MVNNGSKMANNGYSPTTQYPHSYGFCISVCYLCFPACPSVSLPSSPRFTEYQEEIVRKKKEQFAKVAVFPCKLRVMADHIYTRRDPIVAGVKVEVRNKIVTASEIQ